MSGRCRAFARSGRPAFNFTFRSSTKPRSPRASPPPLGKYTASSPLRFTCSPSRLRAELLCAMSMIPLQTAAKIASRRGLDCSALSLQGGIRVDDGG
ncbi:hypothetical protein SUGI_0737030 [Cryptomeria japonica]|nr:hypothetical protein SUGI_0737030 [Cryptomeria japonica]